MELTVHVELGDVLKLIQQLPDEDLAKIKAEVEKRTGETPEPARKRQAGTLKGIVLYMAPDFDDEMEDFKDYM